METIRKPVSGDPSSTTSVTTPKEVPDSSSPHKPGAELSTISATGLSGLPLEIQVKIGNTLWLKELLQLRQADLKLNESMTTVLSNYTPHINAPEKLTEEALTSLKLVKKLFLTFPDPKARKVGIGKRSELKEEGMQFVGKLTNLYALTLSWVQFTNDWLQHFKDLTNLHTLNLSGSTISDDGLKHLKCMKNLHTLVLVGAKEVTDNGLQHLYDLENLKEICLQGTNVTNDGRKNLAKKMPNLLIKG